MTDQPHILIVESPYYEKITVFLKWMQELAELLSNEEFKVFPDLNSLLKN